MNLFIPSHQELLSKLNDFKVDFIIIDGYSVIYHGYTRTTGDVDIWLKPNNQNKLKLINALKDLDFLEEAIEYISNLDFTKHVTFSFGAEPEKVDFITIINLVNFEEADKLKILEKVDGLKIPFLHLNHLILSKFNTGRPQDLADIDRLQRIHQGKERK